MRPVVVAWPIMHMLCKATLWTRQVRILRLTLTSRRGAVDTAEPWFLYFLFKSSIFIISLLLVYYISSLCSFTVDEATLQN
jgi:hypothetical protein